MIDLTNLRIDRCGRHGHFTKRDLQILFRNEPVTRKQGLLIPGEFTIREKVNIRGTSPSNKSIENVTVICPPREVSYVEISKRDAHYLGYSLDSIKRMYAQTKEEIKAAPGIVVCTEYGTIIAQAIISPPHIHMDKVDGPNRIDLEITSDYFNTIWYDVLVKENPGTPMPILHVEEEIYNILTFGGKEPQVNISEPISAQVLSQDGYFEKFINDYAYHEDD